MIHRLASTAEKDSKVANEPFPNYIFSLEIYEAGVWLIKFRAPHNILVCVVIFPSINR